MVEQLFKGKYTLNATRSQYNQSFKTYQLIVAFEVFTGNGDGDIVSSLDSDGGESDTKKRAILGFKTHLTGVKAARHAVVGLSAKTISEWYDCGRYQLFHDRYVRQHLLISALHTYLSQTFYEPKSPSGHCSPFKC